MARAALIARDYDQAAAYAKETKTLALEQLKHRPLDAEPHLATALGAAIEVQAQTLELGVSERRQLPSCRPRYRLTATLPSGTAAEKPEPAVVRRTACAATSNRAISGIKTASLAQLKGSPVLLFFWAHWCVDAKPRLPSSPNCARNLLPRD